MRTRLSRPIRLERLGCAYLWCCVRGARSDDCANMFHGETKEVR